MVTFSYNLNYQHMRILLAYFFIFISFSLFAQNKKALIVGISDYPNSSNWSNIHSDNDVELLKEVLTDIGFSIRIVKDNNATKKNIIQALYKLHNEVRFRDSVLIHFSCHGQLYLTEEGKLIESLIPYDAQKYYKKDVYQGDNHLMDYELGSFLDKIRSKIGEKGLLFVTIDACHSGDIVRALDEDTPVRGTNSVFTSDALYVIPNKKEVKKNMVIPMLNDMSQFCVVYACQPYQRNFELKVKDKYYGSLSYAFYNALKKFKSFDPRLLTGDIMNTMNKIVRKQNPYYESTFTVK